MTTGRRRRCGWLDLVQLRHSHAVNHYSVLNLTKLDVLDSFATIRVGVAYRLVDDGRTVTVTTAFPANLKTLARCEVVYEDLPGWECATTGVRRWEDLPERARGFVEFVERGVGVRVGWVGTGAGREMVVVR